MRTIIFAIATVFITVAQAENFTCYETVDTINAAEIEAQGWSYHGIEGLTAEGLLDMLVNVEEWSNELDQGLADEIFDSYVAKGEYEYYFLTGTGDYSGGYQELIIVDPANSCNEVARFLTYAE